MSSWNELETVNATSECERCIEIGLKTGREQFLNGNNGCVGICIMFLVLFKEIIIGGHGVNHLHLAQAKMLGEPSKAALKL